MSNALRLLGCALLLDSSCFAASLEFSGYLRVGNETHFVVTTVEEKQSSGWLIAGQSFRGYTIVAFDPKEELLFLQKGDEQVPLRLKSSKVKDGGLEMKPPPEFYEAKRGDTPQKIAKTNGLSVFEVWVLNPRVNWARLRVGQGIRLREGK
jgi:hypothetical protein